MKHHPAWIVAAALMIGGVAGFSNSARAEEPPASEVLPAELAQWNEGLRQAGASPAEVSNFKELLRLQSPLGLNAMRERVQMPQFFVKYLRGVRQQEGQQRIPKAIFQDSTPIRSCESLLNVAIPNTKVDSTTIDPLDGSCRVTASVTHQPAADRVRVFVALPQNSWNGRFRGTGGGGFWGGTEMSLRDPVSKGYVTAATDTGHQGGSGSFALNANGRLNWQDIRNNAYLGIHDMTLVGKALTLAFYGKAPRYSYFVGTSTAGRQGLMEAQRFPEDYDGIISGCPAVSWPRMIPAAFWPQEIMHKAGNYLPKAKLERVTAAAISACDGLDGVVDGVIGDPSRCTYDPKALVGTRIEESTFTEVDANLVRKIWEGPRTHDGKFLWYGLARGADLSAIAGTGGVPPIGKPIDVALEYLQYFLVQDPRWDWTSITSGEYELLFNQSVEEFGAVIGSDDPDLTLFRDHGGKLILYHGLADQLIPAQGTVDYYRQVQQKMGGAQATMQFARLFLVPGVDHGFIGAGPSPTGLMDAIVSWVEDGKASERVIAELPDDNGEIIRTRPLFPYPQIAVYKGTGSTDEAANFISHTPTQTGKP
jgi:feruloyl esterase